MRKRWPLWLVAQAFVMACAAGAACLAPLVFAEQARALDIALFWCLTPILGALTAFFATRAGLSNYLAWVLPVLCAGGIPWLIIGFPPNFGAVLLCGFVSVVGAATGDVCNKREDSAHDAKGCGKT